MYLELIGFGYIRYIASSVTGLIYLLRPIKGKRSGRIFQKLAANLVCDLGQHRLFGFLNHLDLDDMPAETRSHWFTDLTRLHGKGSIRKGLNHAISGKESQIAPLVLTTRIIRIFPG